MHHRLKIKKGIAEETKKDNFKIFMDQCNMTMTDNESIENNIIYNETQLAEPSILIKQNVYFNEINFTGYFCYILIKIRYKYD